MRTRLMIAAAATATLLAGAAYAQAPAASGSNFTQAPPAAGDTAVNPSPGASPSAPSDSATVAPAAGAPIERTSASTAGADLVTNGPVPDTRANRAKYGQPMSNAGRHTKAAGN